MASQFKILKKAVELFKKINNGEDESKLRYYNQKVELFNERDFNSLEFDSPEYVLFDFNNELENRTALEHARNCAYEIIIEKQ